MALIGTGFEGVSIGSDAYLASAAVRGSAGTLYVQTLVTAATGNFTTSTIPTMTPTTIAGTPAFSGYATQTVSSFTTFGASAAVATPWAGTVAYASAAAVVSGGADTLILNGAAGRVQYLRNDSAGVISVVPPSGGTIHGVSAYAVSASSSHLVGQVTALISFGLKNG